jgi:dynein heavy chain
MAEDPRAQWLREYTLKSMPKCKADKWDKLTGDEERFITIIDFLEKKEVKMLVIGVDPKGQLLPRHSFPESLKKQEKAVYYIKAGEDVTLTKDNMATLLRGDMSYEIVEALAVLVEGLVVPSLSDQANVSSWPGVVASDVYLNAQLLQNSAAVIAGQMQGKTQLPLPVSAGADSQTTTDSVAPETVHGYETAVIDWAHQILNVLKHDSAQPLMDGLNPLAQAECDFWSAKLSNLVYLDEQLNTPELTRIQEVLESEKSSYAPTFAQLKHDVADALVECEDITLYLEPIRPLVDEMEQTDFIDVPQLFEQILHLLTLVYVQSKHYNTPRKMVVFLRELFNGLIEAVINEVEPRAVFGLDPLDAQAKITGAVEVVTKVITSYKAYRGKLNAQIRDQKLAVDEWSFEDRLVLARLQGFRTRLGEMNEVMAMRVHFEKIEKVELSNVLEAAKVVAVGTDFNETYAAWTKLTSDEGPDVYDPLEPSSIEWTRDFTQFFKDIEDLDLRLAAVANTTFDLQTSLEGYFRVIHGFQGLLTERPTIFEAVKHQFDAMVPLFHNELDAVVVFFNTYETSPNLPRNMPNVSGALDVARQLRSRITIFNKNLLSLKGEVSAFGSPEAVNAYRKFHEMTDKLAKHDQEVFKKWAATVAADSQVNLDQQLMVRDPETRLLSINFNPQLVAVLREVKYMELAKTEAVAMPDEAQEVYARNETFRQYLGNLGIVATEYNRVQKELISVEAPLLLRELASADEKIERALKELTWNSEGVGEYCRDAKEAVENISNRLMEAKSNVTAVFEELEKLYAAPMLARDEKTGLMPFNERSRQLKRAYAAIAEAGKSFSLCAQKNAAAFRADKDSEIWKNYLDYVDSMILDGLYNAVFATVNYILDCMEDELEANKGMPILNGALKLELPDCLYFPSMIAAEDAGEDPATSLVDWMLAYLSDFYHIGSLIPRVATHKEDTDYRKDLENSPDLKELQDELVYKAQSVMAKALDYQDAYVTEYQHLWTDDIPTFMEEFLKYGKVRTTEEKEAWAEENDDKPMPETPPTLDDFKAVIDQHDAIAEKVIALEDTAVFEKWFRADIKPFKVSLHAQVKKWSNAIIDYLSNKVTGTLAELEAFIKTADQGLGNEVPEGDYDALVGVMTFLNEVNSRREETDNGFDPLKEIVSLLQGFNVELPEEVVEKLTTLPDKWNATKKLASEVSSDVAPAQAEEVTKLKSRMNQFDMKNFAFREDFLKRAPTTSTSEDVYRRIDGHYTEYLIMEEEMVDLEARAALLTVRLPEYKQVRACRKELGFMKELWDTIFAVRFQFAAWSSTLWNDVDVEMMENACKKMVKEIRLLPKEARAWEAFNGVDADVKNMITSLGAVNLLQDSAIRERHWGQVMETTGVKIEMSDETVLEDLLKLQLHEYEDDVATIVDRAKKELQMEKMVNELEKVWAEFNVEFDHHKRTKVPQVKVAEEVIEVLEDNQVNLQNLLASKFIAFFKVQVGSWSAKLSTADQVLEIWMEVQRTWSNLESIFIASEDIRGQLPEDAKRFDGIDVDFKELAYRSEKITNVVECCNQPKMFEQLENMQDRLTLCEKALNEYLDTKRLAFPRFYFVSSADLLDILSNGNNPAIVAKQLSKLFCSINNLTIPGAEEGKKMATHMIALDGEVVEFRNEEGAGAVCDCGGRVEEWLMNVQTTMQETLRWAEKDSLIEYEEKKRDQWVFDWPAQVALVGTQVWWATEVNLAFGRLEEGYENAMKDYNKKQISNLNDLILHLQGTLTKANRVMLQTICTVDVHSRDVTGGLIQKKAENAESFDWVSQLRHSWDDEINHTRIAICDARFIYSCEWLGNIPRLVITPLTDRCYITLTQSLHLKMSGAPAGPAGTGKTETTKDLSRNIGIMIYVFNCSEQMDYKSTGNIFKGLSQVGAWGCFDEFNRISIEVLSVVAVQVKCVQDAIKDKKKRFNFLGENIVLNMRVGLWITMNPGYAGRTALPENIKVLFRPCAMVVPDYGMICEIMLVSEGFLTANLLGQKFITLYSLNRDLLSKQDHYDWGLRAIKSVLVVAGKLKRADPDRSEEEVLMRALRDFNIPKLVNEDLPVFMGLIGDLFPGLDVPRTADVPFEKLIVQAITERKLQPEDAFVLKVVQLEELLEVRHSVFIIGLAATGKSCVLKALFDVYRLQGQKPVWCDLNPKACTNHELYGYINMATRDWVDGLFSSLMRDMSNIDNDHNKWLVFDGDIDTMWVESLNTVMDDNKILTLASNERIPLNPTMRMLFEIANLSYASPATVSRAGILFVNPTDLGWNPCVQTWIDNLESPGQRSNLMMLFEKYIPPLLEAMKIRFKTITPIPEWTLLNTLCNMLALILTQENTPEGCSKEDYELYFSWCCIWAFGGAMFKDQLVDWREEFTKWWLSEFKTIKYPSTGTVFDYWIRREDKKFVSWAEKIPKFTFDGEIPVSAAMVHTAETTRLKFWMDLFLEAGKPMVFVGAPGTGKTATVLDTLNRLDTDNWMVAQTSFNHYTIHHTMQAALEEPLEKKAGRNYGPPGTKRLVYFIDDLNMPEVDLYGTQGAHTIMRQVLDYNHWYDRVKKSLRVVSKAQFVCAMNPKAGSFVINPRLLRHMVVFALSPPSDAALTTIYSQLFAGHLKAEGFAKPIEKIGMKLVDAAVKIHSKTASTFLPTAIKFHYLFNLRDLSNVFQGVHFSQPDRFKTPISMIRLLMHETDRVYSDKMITKDDVEAFGALQTQVIKETFPDIEMEKVVEQPNLHCHFAEGIGDPLYAAVKGWDSLFTIMTEALQNYNEVNAAMDLVLFRDAMQHVCRINRILESPRGNALLVGVGGSGKQSLARLSASVSGLDTFQIALSKGYGLTQLKEDLLNCFIKTGSKNIGVMFLMTDAQVAEEKFLVLINDLLSSGEIPGLFGPDEKNEAIDAVRNDVKAQGLEDSPLNCWKFFIERVRSLLKVVLCFSPVGDTLRTRARMFPGVVNCTSIDWFFDWPYDALQSVAKNFLAQNELIPEEYVPSMGEFMAKVHDSVNATSKIYLSKEKRFNYTTPKSFLEQVSLYQSLLGQKINECQLGIDRMENGLTKLNATAAQVDDMKEKLKAQDIELAEKNAAANALIETVGIETVKVNKEKDIAAVEEEKVSVLSKEVGQKKSDCERDLAKAEPALIAAQAALDTLSKNNLTELKSFGSPPPICVVVVAAVMVLMWPDGKKLPKDRSWKACKIGVMGNVGEFLDNLLTYDKENVPAQSLKEIKKNYLTADGFNAENVAGKSQAAAGLCSWVINIITFFEVYCDVEPKRLALADANAQLEAANTKLAKIMAQIKTLDEALAKLTANFDEATSAKMKCQAEADKTKKVIGLANRLVGGLASEKVRWGETVTNLKAKMLVLPGDCMLTTAFLSYCGCFSKDYRTVMYDEVWMPFITKQSKPVPITENLDPLDLLTDPAMVAGWQNDHLPADRVSTENAAILSNAKRWPLIIDPQEQGIKWIKEKESKGDFVVLRLSQKGYLDKIERAISNGSTVLIENIFEDVDAVLGDVIGQNTIKKGRAIMLGDKEVEYNNKFRLILHTKMGNPHYKPEMQAQTTLINFTVTQSGLEDQLLADVVATERTDLQELKTKLTKDNNEFMITLKSLEDNLLQKLSSAEGNFLEDEALVVGLEDTKKTATEISEKVELAKVTEVDINKAREKYRPAAARGSLMYFILSALEKLHPMYQVSLKSFNVVFMFAVRRAIKDDDVEIRVKNIIDTVTHQVYIYMSRGLFERDKLIFASQMVFAVMRLRGDLDEAELAFLLRCPGLPTPAPVEFLTPALWGNVKACSALEVFAGFDRDIEGSAKRWQKFCESEVPEREKFPGDWKAKTALQQLCMLRCLRPDRMMNAMSIFIGEQLGDKYVSSAAMPFSESYKETSTSTGVFFILSPGVNPIADVEELGKKMGFTFDNEKYLMVSLGQGQEPIAEEAMKRAAKEGLWVVLENIHLVVKWLKDLEKTIEECQLTGHKDFRFYLTAEPAASAEYHIMPSGILQACIKITNEPPSGVQANLHEALACFDQDTLEMCARENEFRKILFALLYHHSVLIERRKFGPIGWNVNYPFNKGDLKACVDVLFNYLEANSVVPWLDLRYIFGEIMYGGHITDNIDRRLESTYLQEYLKPEMLDVDLELAPGFVQPGVMDYEEYHSYIDENIPPESPYLYGLHPNAEIDYLTNTSQRLFTEVLGMIGGASSGGGGKSKEEIINENLDEFLDKLPDEFNMYELNGKVPPEERTPYINVALQECNRMNRLLNAIRNGLREVKLGLKGELTVTPVMEGIENALFFDTVPANWGVIMGPSTKPLGTWFLDLFERVKCLEVWTGDITALPSCVWLGGLFNPQAFLTAIGQQTARKNEWPLDKVVLTIDVTKKYNKDDFGSAPREGAYLYGLYMAGARWDTQTGLIQEARLKELCPPMPVIFCKAIPLDKLDLRGTYSCPTFKTVERGRAKEAVAVGLCPGFVWYFNLKTKVHPNKWTLAGCAMTLSD